MTAEVGFTHLLPAPPTRKSTFLCTQARYLSAPSCHYVHKTQMVQLKSFVWPPLNFPYLWRTERRRKKRREEKRRAEERRGGEKEKRREEKLTWEHHLHQISLLDVAGIFHQLEDVVCRCVVFEQKDLIVDAIEAALWELEDKTRSETEHQKWAKSGIDTHWHIRFVAFTHIVMGAKKQY